MSLKSIDDHNRERRFARQEAERRLRLTGVACPKCGGEMEWQETWLSVSSYPPPTTRQATCAACKVTAQLEA